MEQKYILKPITTLMLTLTNQCNLRCSYCFTNKDVKKMSLNTAKQCSEFVYQNTLIRGNHPSLTFFGGEPLLEWDSIIAPLLSYNKQHYPVKFHYSMTTNGLLLTERRIKIMKNNGFGFLLSIDGDRDSQNTNRKTIDGHDTFDVLYNKLPMILEYYPKQKFRATVTPYTAKNLFNDILFFGDMGCKVCDFRLNLFDNWDDKTKSELENQIVKYTDYIIDSYHNHRIPVIFEDYMRMFYKIVLINQSIDGNLYRQVSPCVPTGKCGLGCQGHGGTDTVGNIYGCLHNAPLNGKPNQFYIGNVFTGIENDKIKALIDLCATHEVYSKTYKCSDCKLNRICSGGCPSNNYILTGDVSIAPDVFCWWYQLLLREAERVTTVLGTENNTMFIKLFTNIVKEASFGI